jgi:hypothetical protein
MNIELQDILFDLGIPTEVLLTLVLIQFPIWIWSIVLIAKKRTKEPTDRIVWLLVALFLGILGTILYFIFGREKQIESEIESTEVMKDFEQWKKGDPARSYLSQEDQRAGFADYKKKT